MSTNHAGEVLGFSFDDYGPNSGYIGGRGYLYDGSNFTLLDAPNADLSRDGTIPESINSSGTIVGIFAPIGSTGRDGFVRDASGNYTILSHPGASETFALGITDSGIVAGSYDVGDISHSFLWSSSTGFTDFDLPFGVNTEIWGINNVGNLVGDYIAEPPTDTFPGLYRSFIASPAPEPGTMGLCLLAATGGLPFFVRRSREAKSA